jgi:hypothetical protein
MQQRIKLRLMILVLHKIKCAKTKKKLNNPWLIIKKCEALFLVEAFPDKLQGICDSGAPVGPAVCPVAYPKLVGDLFIR